MEDGIESVYGVRMTLVWMDVIERWPTIDYRLSTLDAPQLSRAVLCVSYVTTTTTTARDRIDACSFIRLKETVSVERACSVNALVAASCSAGLLIH